MNIFEIFDKAKTAKQKGKKYQYADTPVKFEFRCLSVNEGRAISKLAKAAADASNTDAILSELIKINPLVGWEGMTKGLLEDISALKLDIPEEEKSEEIPYADEHSQRMLATCVGFDGQEIKNIPFLNFMSECIKDAAEAKKAEVSAQKKM